MKRSLLSPNESWIAACSNTRTPAERAAFCAHARRLATVARNINPNEQFPKHSMARANRPHEYEF